MSPLMDGFQGSVRVRLADAPGHIAVFRQRIFQSVGDHQKTLLFIIPQGDQRVIGLLKGMGSVIIIRIDHRERRVDQLPAAQDGMARAEGFHPSLRNAEPFRQVSQLLKRVGNLHMPGDPVPDQASEVLLDLMFNQEDHPLKPGSPGIKNAVIQDGLPVRPDRIHLLQPAVAAPHSRRHNQENRSDIFVHWCISLRYL